jgi:signal transduction histidine kinase
MNSDQNHEKLQNSMPDIRTHSPQWALGITGLTLVILLWLLARLSDWYKQEIIKQNQAYILTQLSAYGNQLMIAINHRFSLLDALRAFIKIQESAKISQDEFNLFASGLYAGVPGIRNFSIAPKGVQRYIYPLAGNEKAIGHNLIDDPRPLVRLDVQRTIESQQLTLSGPYELLQGGLGLVARQAIYRNNQFWGLVAMVIDVPPLINESGIPKAPQEDQLEIAVKDNNDRVFYGKAEVFSNQPILYEIKLPEGSWTLAAVPSQGWNNQIKQPLLIFQITGLLIICLITTLVNLILIRQVSLELAVQQRTKKILQTSQQMEAEIRERQKTEQLLAAYNQNLEEEVIRRTAELIESNNQLEIAKNKTEISSQYKSVFIANMSHEFRTPLNAIIGFCELLRNSVKDSRLKRYVEAIYSSGKFLLFLINDILDLSKIEAGKLDVIYEPVNMRMVIQEIEQIFSNTARQKKLLLFSDIDQKLPQILYFDEVRLRQILFNVVGNALKFTEQGFIKISLTTTENTPDNVKKSEGLLNDSLLDFSIRNEAAVQVVSLTLSIEDTGIGISPQDKLLIFDAFAQSNRHSNRKYSGTGLGLAITKRLTEMLGGTIDLESELNSGSIFTFNFPNVRVFDSAIAKSELPIAIEPNLDPVQSRAKPDREPNNSIIDIDRGSDRISNENIPETLPLISQEAFTELMEQLEIEQMTIWPELCQTMKFRELQAFSDRLNQWAEQYPLADLLDYANQVANQLETFDWERLPDTIAQFPEIIESLEAKFNQQ